jgi:hypothetical protein
MKLDVDSHGEETIFFDIMEVPKLREKLLIPFNFTEHVEKKNKYLLFQFDTDTGGHSFYKGEPTVINKNLALVVKPEAVEELMGLISLGLQMKEKIKEINKIMEK